MPYLLTNTDYTVTRQQKPVIHLFARDEKGDRHTFKIEGFKPYFWTTEEAAIALKLPYKADSLKPTTDGKWVVKIVMDIPRQVGAVKKEIIEAGYDTWEADVLYPWRFLIDRGIKAYFDWKDGEYWPSGVPETPELRDVHLTKLFVDIETETFGTVPKPEEANALLITIVTRFIDENKGINEEMIFTSTNETEEKVQLQKLVKYIAEVDPDVVTAWNIAFDFGHIINRCRKYDIWVNRISPMNYVAYQKRFNMISKREFYNVKILGRSAIDEGNDPTFNANNMYAKYNQNKLFPSFRLEYIAELECDLPQDHFDYDMMKRENANIIVPYCQRDVERSVAIEQKLHLVDHFDRIRRVCGCDLAASMVTSKYADHLMLRKYNGYLVCKSKQYGVDDGEKYKGALVIQPRNGIYYWVILLDFKQMYPYNVIGMNISPETLSEKCHTAEWMNLAVATTNDESCGCHVIEIAPAAFVHYRKDIEGKVPEAFKEMIALRDQLKGWMRNTPTDDPEYAVFDGAQYSVKQISAAMYGFFAFRGARFYDKRIAASITALGRLYINMTVDHVEGEGYRNLYGDTDSIMVIVGEKAVDDVDSVVAKGKQLEDEINVIFRDFAKKGNMGLAPLIQFEKVFKTILFPRKIKGQKSDPKKRYGAHEVWEEDQLIDTLYIRGLETRKSSSPELSRKVQKDVLNIILRDKGEKALFDYLKGVRNNFLEGSYSDIGIPKSLRKDLTEYGGSPARNIGIHYANEFLGANYDAGTRTMVFWVESVPEKYPDEITLINGKTYPIKRVALEEDQFEEWHPHIDWETQWEKIVEAAVDKIIQPAGYELDLVIQGQRQTSLEAWI